MFLFSTPYPGNRSCNFSSLFPVNDNADLYSNTVNPRVVDRQHEFMYSAVHNLKKKHGIEKIEELEKTRLICESYIGHVDALAGTIRKNECSVTIDEKSMENNPKNGVCRWTGSNALQASQGSDIVSEAPYFCFGFEKVMASTVCCIVSINLGELYMKEDDNGRAAAYFAMSLVYVAWAKAFIEKCTFASRMPEMQKSVQDGIAFYATARGVHAAHRHSMQKCTEDKPAGILVKYYAALCNICTASYESINIGGSIEDVRGIAMVAQFLRMEYMSRAHQYLSMHLMSCSDVRDSLGRVDMDKIDYQLCYNVLLAALIFAKKAQAIADRKNMVNVKTVCKERIFVMTGQLNTLQMTSKHTRKTYKFATEDIIQNNPFIYTTLIRANIDTSDFNAYLDHAKSVIIDTYNK